MSGGPSPRVRGEPEGTPRPAPTGSVYPRTRGATWLDRSRLPRDAGLSPHARGNQTLTGRRYSMGRSIPARAGQPSWHHLVNDILRVYPRTRGATILASSGKRHTEGLSPHARGNQGGAATDDGDKRSIPARAGQPQWGGAKLTHEEVYPRTRGATTGRSYRPMDRTGLSPHARGNRVRRVSASVKWRSIPARAGQPGPHRETACLLPVYPRTRGATLAASDPVLAVAGLSPHARGNLGGEAPGQVD